MSAPAGLPPYPPAKNAWNFPPPPVSRRWKWVAIAASVVAAVLVAGLLTAAVVLGSRDAPGLIEDADVVKVVERECTIMRETIEALPIRGSRRQRLGVLRDQNEAIAKMVAGVRALGDAALDADRPTRAWLEDWELLIEAREAYIALARSGLVPQQLPLPRLGNGDRLDERMDRVWLQHPDTCDVPRELLEPVPGEAAEV